MDQTGINGSNQFFAPVPAGFATRDISGAGGVIALTSSESAADIIELTGVLTGPVTIVIATPTQIPQIVGTTQPLGSIYKRSFSWSKIIADLTTGAFAITIVGPGGTGKVVQALKAMWFYSPDGVNVQDVCCTGQ